MPDLIVNNKKFSYQVIRKKNSSIRLSLKSPTKILITAPWLTPELIIKKFIYSNSEWIVNNSQKIKKFPKINSIQDIKILGDDYELIINKTPNNSVIIFENNKKIFVNTNSLAEPHLKRILESRLRRLSLSLIKLEIRKIIRTHPFKYNKITVRNQKTRYGSCSSSGSLNFNWQIIFFPLPVFRHIIFHELVHLEIKDHSSHFWQTLALYDSNWKTNNLWLKKEGPKYFIIKP